jgi:hypothetical protein
MRFPKQLMLLRFGFSAARVIDEGNYKLTAMATSGIIIPLANTQFALQIAGL